MRKFEDGSVDDVVKEVERRSNHLYALLRKG